MANEDGCVSGFVEDEWGEEYEDEEGGFNG